MNPILPLTLLLLLVPSCHAQEPPKAPPSLPPIEIYFSPQGGCTEAVVKEINASKTDILVQAYSFTSVPITPVSRSWVSDEKNEAISATSPAQGDC